MLGDLLGGAIRKELKTRVDEILRCGGDWCTTAKELKESMDKLTAAIEESEATPDQINRVAKETKKLSEKTVRLATAFETFNNRIGDALTGLT